MNEHIQENQSQLLKVVLTSEHHQPELLTHLENLEIKTDWQALPSSPEEGFTFLYLKPIFEKAESQAADLVIALGSLPHTFAIGFRKYPNSNFILANIHQLTVMISRLLLENHDQMELHRSIFVTDAADRFFQAKKYPVTVHTALLSPLENQPQYLDIPDGSLIVSENQSIQIKGQRDSNLYLLSRIILEAKKAKNNNQTLFDFLIQTYQTYGYQREKLLSVSILEKSQQKFFKNIFDRFRKKPPVKLGVADILKIEDLQNGTIKNLLSGRIVPSPLPYALGIQIYLGTQVRLLMLWGEDKLFFLFTSEGRLVSHEDFGRINQQYDQQAVKLIEEINRLGRES